MNCPCSAGGRVGPAGYPCQRWGRGGLGRGPWAGALPFASLGHRQRVAAVRSVCAADGKLAVVGGWLSGNGLAAIVADTPQQVGTLLS